MEILGESIPGGANSSCKGPEVRGSLAEIKKTERSVAGQGEANFWENSRHSGAPAKILRSGIRPLGLMGLAEEAQRSERPRRPHHSAAPMGVTLFVSSASYVPPLFFLSPLARPGPNLRPQDPTSTGLEKRDLLA